VHFINLKYLIFINGWSRCYWTCIQKYDYDFITPYCHKKSLHDKITEEGSIMQLQVRSGLLACVASCPAGNGRDWPFAAVQCAWPVGRSMGSVGQTADGKPAGRWRCTWNRWKSGTASETVGAYVRLRSSDREGEQCQPVTRLNRSFVRHPHGHRDALSASRSPTPRDVLG
jgi:hypothetical protein